MNAIADDSQALDFLALQNPATMRPFVQEVDGLLSLRFDMATVQSVLRLAEANALELEYTRTRMAPVHQETLTRRASNRLTFAPLF